MSHKPESFEEFLAKFFTASASANLTFNATGSSSPPVLTPGELLKIKKDWAKKCGEQPSSSLWLDGLPKFECVSPKPKDFHFLDCVGMLCGEPPAYSQVDVDFDGQPNHAVVKIPGGIAIVRKLDEHLASLRRQRDAEFDEGLRELRTAMRGGVWGG